MRKLSAFIFLSLNGYYKDGQNDISWHRHGQEENEFASDSMKSDNILLFGRITYELMAGYWPTPMAMQQDPDVAAGMNQASKIVFSRTLTSTGWNNTTIMKENVLEQITKMKETPGHDMTILGSGTVVSQFTAHHLIDEFALMIDPVILDKGTSLFSGIPVSQNLQLVNSRTFKSGAVLLQYRPKT